MFYQFVKIKSLFQSSRVYFPFMKDELLFAIKFKLAAKYHKGELVLKGGKPMFILSVPSSGQCLYNKLDHETVYTVNWVMHS